MSAVRVLVVCTANQCRSPMAAALLARRLGDVGLEARVGSAGVSADGASPATGNAIRVMREHELAISRHRSRRLDAGLVSGADLVLGMSRAHVREAIVLEPAAMAYAFTLKELVRRSDAARRRERPLDDWLAELGAWRSADVLLGDSPEDDVADPIGLPLREYRETAAQLDALTRRLVANAWAAP